MKKYLLLIILNFNLILIYGQEVSDVDFHHKGDSNELGIYDMSGNVWEWCYDWYDDYPKDSKNNPRGPRRGSSVVVRGGSWLYYGSFCRVANRGSSAPGYAFNNYGFRVMIPK